MTILWIFSPILQLMYSWLVAAKFRGKFRFADQRGVNLGINPLRLVGECTALLATVEREGTCPESRPFAQVESQPLEIGTQLTAVGDGIARDSDTIPRCCRSLVVRLRLEQCRKPMPE